MDPYLKVAMEEARKGMQTGGVPIGSVMVIDGKIVGRGHNRQNQMQSIIRHAEMDCIDNAGALTPAEYKQAILYTTLSPCDMCAGAILFFNIPKLVIGENRNYRGAEEYLTARGIAIEVLNDPECIRMLRVFDEQNPGVWNKGE